MKKFLKRIKPDAISQFFIIQLIIFLICRWLWGDDMSIYLRMLYPIMFFLHLGWTLER